MSSAFPADSLWDFSLSLYANRELADACLHLQDQQGVNVNLILWCAWLEYLGVYLEDAHLQEAHHHVDAWDQHYVIPLRQLRRRMKAEFGTADANIEAVRASIQQAELAAEKELQRRLQQISYGWLEQNGAVELVSEAMGNRYWEGKNLRRYLHQAGVEGGAIDSLLQCLNGVLRNI